MSVFQTHITRADDGAATWRILEAVARRRRFVFLFVVLVTIGAAIVSLVLPVKYRAEALLLPPKDMSVAIADNASRLADLSNLIGGVTLPTMATASDVFVRILKSRTIADRVIDSLSLMKRYGVSTRSEARLALSEFTDFRVTDEGLIHLQAIDREPARAAEMANLFIRELERMLGEVTSARTAQSRQFLEKRLAEARIELDSARLALKAFQKENKALDLDRQTELAMSSAVALKVDLSDAEVDMNVKRQTFSATHPEVVELSRRVRELRTKIQELEYGGSDSSYFSLAVADAPALGARLADLKTRVAVAEKLFENLVVRYDEARIQEKRDASGMSVMDWADSPEIRWRPKRTLIVAGAFFGSLILATLVALFFEYLARLESQSPSDFVRFRYILSALSGKRDPTPPSSRLE